MVFSLSIKHLFFPGTPDNSLRYPVISEMIIRILFAKCVYPLSFTPDPPLCDRLRRVPPHNPLPEIFYARPAACATVCDCVPPHQSLNPKSFMQDPPRLRPFATVYHRTTLYPKSFMPDLSRVRPCATVCDRVPPHNPLPEIFYARPAACATVCDCVPPHNPLPEIFYARPVAFATVCDRLRPCGDSEKLGKHFRFRLHKLLHLLAAQASVIHLSKQVDMPSLYVRFRSFQDLLSACCSC